MSRTPVSLLQELMQKRGSLVHYEELPSDGHGTHNPTFYIRAKAEDVVKIGKARSKKEAKHEAAKLALEALSEKGIYHPDSYSTKSSAAPAAAATAPTATSDIYINAVGTLKDICAENNIPEPEFNELSAVGPPHARQFTIECKIGKMPGTCATELTKKKAKQNAAQKMLDRLEKSLPDLIQEFKTMTCAQNVPAITQDVMDCYNQLTVQKKKINLGLKVSSYPKTLTKIMREKDITYDSLWKEFNQFLDEGSLRDLLDKLELTYTIFFRELETKKACFATINTDPEFALVKTGRTEEEAKREILHQTVEFLKIMTK